MGQNENNESYFWLAPAFGLIIGSAPGGAGNKDDEKSEGQGYFAPFGIGMWLYGGISAGIGRTFGPYLTTGPMFGTTLDWAVGGGIQYKGFGLGIILPVAETIKSMNRHQHTLSYLTGQSQYLLASTQYYAGEALHTLSQMGGLEQMLMG